MASLTNSEFNFLRFLTRVTNLDHPTGFSEVSPYLLPYSTIEFDGKTASEEEEPKTIQFSPRFVEHLNQILSQYMFKTILRWKGWKVRPYTVDSAKVHCRIFDLNLFPQRFGLFALQFWTWMIEEACQIIEFDKKKQKEPITRIPPSPRTPEDHILNLFFISDIVFSMVNSHSDRLLYEKLNRYIPDQCRQTTLCLALLDVRLPYFIPPEAEINSMQRSILESMSDFIPACVKFILKKRTHSGDFRTKTLPGLKIKLSALYKLIKKEEGVIFLEHYIGVGESLIEEELFLETLKTNSTPFNSPDGNEFFLEIQEFLRLYLGQMKKLRAHLQSFTFMDKDYENSRWGLEVMDRRWDPIASRFEEILESIETVHGIAANGESIEL